MRRANKCLKQPPKLGEANVLLSQFNGQTGNFADGNLQQKN